MKPLRIVPILLYTLLMALSVSCSDDAVVADGQEIYFEVYYTNEAWGSQRKGFLIDKQGQVRTYDMPANWNDANIKTTLSKEEMEANVSQTTVSSIKIDGAELEKYIKTSAGIAGKDFSKPVPGGADLGLTRFYSYTYNAGKKTYTAVLLRQTGNVTIHNQDTNAKAVADWLVKIMDEVY
ncbi:hypothetical protein [Dyadobacter sp. 676]|uniref:DUF1795 domain-containing protein n=1 Tax=Dyadobacter sp. 676 TaxID=3088362 RepID=A0AAU8FKG8_9BACT